MLRNVPPEAIICTHLARPSACSFINNQCREKTHAEEIIQLQ